MRKDVGTYFKEVSDSAQRELSNDEIYEAFVKEYQNRNDTIKAISYNVDNEENQTTIHIKFKINNEIIRKTASGNGPIAATINILKELGYDFEFKNYIQQSSQNKEESSEAITYINIKKDEKSIWAVGKDEDVLKSSLLVIISAVNKI